MTEYIKKRFDPKPDITTYELAKIMRHLKFGWAPLSQEAVNFADETWDKLPEELKRHWR